MSIHTKYIYTNFSSLQRELRFLQNRLDSTPVTDLLTGKKVYFLLLRDRL